MLNVQCSIEMHSFSIWASSLKMKLYELNALHFHCPQGPVGTLSVEH